MNEYLSKLNWRYATKKFDATKKLTAEQLDFLKNAIRLSPSSFGLQPWKFYLVSNPAVRQEMLAASYNQPQISDASHIFVIASRVGFNASDVEAYINDIATTRNVSLESLEPAKNAMFGSISHKTPEALDDWCARQSYLALGFLLSACAENDIDACPMEGFDAAAVSKILNTEADGYFARAYCAVGFRSADDSYAQAAKVRFPLEKIIKEV